MEFVLFGTSDIAQRDGTMPMKASTVLIRRNFFLLLALGLHSEPLYRTSDTNSRESNM